MRRVYYYSNFCKELVHLNSANHNNECAGRLQERILCSIVDTHNVLNQLIVLVRKLF